MASVIDGAQGNERARLTGPSKPCNGVSVVITGRDLETAPSSLNASSINVVASPSPSSPRTKSTVAPPYWLNAHAHRRSASGESALPAGAIRLRDNDTYDDERNSACWARSVEIVDYTVVAGGSGSGVGAFVVWNVRVETLNGSHMNIRKRYSEFEDFRNKLTATFPAFKAAMPELPAKSLIFRFKPKFLENRRAGLQYFLNCIILNPEFSGSPVLREFLFS